MGDGGPKFLLKKGRWVVSRVTKKGAKSVARISGGQVFGLLELMRGVELTCEQAQVLMDSGVFSAVLRAVKNDPDWLKRPGAMDALISPLGLDRHWIDCDAPPFIPEGLTYHEEDQLPSRIRGKILWKKSEAGLWLSERQRGGMIKGTDLFEEIKNLDVLVYPVQVLDYLLKNPDQIPEEWRVENTFFWSPYRDANDYRYVRYLCWLGTSWVYYLCFLGDDWHFRYPAAFSIPSC